MTTPPPDPAPSGGGAPSDDKQEFGPEAKFRPQILLQWFVFPMLVVVLCVGLYLSFSFLTSERKNAMDYLNDLQSGNPHKAWQAAFSLANQVNLDRISEEEKPLVGKLILQMLAESSPGAGQIRQYFILILGRLKFEPAVPRLLDLVGGSEPSEKIYALMALRDMKASAGFEAAAAALNDPDPGVRKTAAYFFGPFLQTSPQEAQKLVPMLNDPAADVRWNAAFSLSEIRDPAALPVLARLLDRPALAEDIEKNSPLDEAKTEKILKSAIVAAGRYHDADLTNRVRRLAELDPNGHVRAAAQRALDRMTEHDTP